MDGKSRKIKISVLEGMIFHGEIFLGKIRFTGIFFGRGSTIIFGQLGSLLLLVVVHLRDVICAHQPADVVSKS